MEKRGLVVLFVFGVFVILMSGGVLGVTSWRPLTDTSCPSVVSPGVFTGHGECQGTGKFCEGIYVSNNNCGGSSTRALSDREDCNTDLSSVALEYQGIYWAKCEECILGSNLGCSGGDICTSGPQGNSCVACTETCANQGYECGVQTICGNSVQCGNCGGNTPACRGDAGGGSTCVECVSSSQCNQAAGEWCANNVCQTSCTPSATLSCHADGNVHSYDSCGADEGIAVDCQGNGCTGMSCDAPGAGTGCSGPTADDGDYACRSGDVDQCNDGTWSKVNDCEAYSGYTSPCQISVARSGVGLARNDCTVDSGGSCTDTCATFGYECGNPYICGSWPNCGTCGSGEECVSNRCEPACGDVGQPCCTSSTPCDGVLTCNAGNVCEDQSGSAGSCSIIDSDLSWRFGGQIVSSVVEGTEVELEINAISSCSGVEVIAWDIVGSNSFDVLNDISSPYLDSDGELVYLWDAELGEDYEFRVLLDGQSEVVSGRLNVSEACYETNGGAFISDCDDYDDYSDSDRTSEDACNQDCAGVGVRQGGKCRWDSTGGTCFFSDYGVSGQDNGYYCRHDYGGVTECSADQPYRVITTTSSKWNESTNTEITTDPLDCVGSCNEIVCDIQSACPKVVQLPFFSFGNVIGIIIIVVIVYVLWSMARKESVQKRKSKKKRGKK